MVNKTGLWLWSKDGISALLFHSSVTCNKLLCLLFFLSFIFFCCYSTAPLSGIILHFCRLQGQSGLTGLKSRGLKAALLSDVSRGESVPRLLQFPDITCVPGSRSLFYPQASSAGQPKSSRCSLSDSLLIASPLLMITRTNAGPLSILRPTNHNLNSTCNLNPSFPRNLTYSQVPRTSM